MTKGTTSQGPRHLKTHTFCRRCGRRAFHRQNKICGACGFPRKTMRRYDGMNIKVRGRKGQGTGKMKYLKEVPRRFRNNFRCKNSYTACLEANGIKKEANKEEKKELQRKKIPRRKLH